MSGDPSPSSEDSLLDLTEGRAMPQIKIPAGVTTDVPETEKLGRSQIYRLVGCGSHGSTVICSVFRECSQGDFGAHPQETSEP